MSSPSPQLSLPSASLYYREGVSDKEYHLAILGSESKGYQVEYKYGRRGSTLKVRFKNAVPVDLEKATKIFESERDKQLRDGYTLGEGGTPYQNTENAGRVSGVLPQLLNFIEEEEVQKYLDDNNWVMQEKKDGIRCMIKKTKKVTNGVNRKGLIIHLPLMVEAAIKDTLGQAEATLDGELVGDTYHVFDALVLGVHSLATKGYMERMEQIRDWLGDMSPDANKHLQIVATAVGKSSKKALYHTLRKYNAEGVVFKKADAIYKVGRPASGGDQIKFKFYATATVRVRCQNDQRSVQMEVLSKGDWKCVGNVTISVNKDIPKAGDIIEVKYLYAYPGGSLFQPTFLTLRSDASEEECLMSQLKYKAGTEEEEDN